MVEGGDQEKSGQERAERRQQIGGTSSLSRWTNNEKNRL
jgi:hypothetical protein